MSITYHDIEDLAQRDDFLGFGYLGHSDRGHDTDVALARAANDLGLDIEDVFLWANSRPARHYMDVAPTQSRLRDQDGWTVSGKLMLAELRHHLEHDLPILRAEEAQA